MKKILQILIVFLTLGYGYFVQAASPVSAFACALTVTGNVNWSTAGWTTCNSTYPGNNAGVNDTVTVTTTTTGTLTLDVSPSNTLGAVTLSRPSTGATFTLAMGANNLNAASVAMSATTAGRNVTITLSTGVLTTSGSITSGGAGNFITFSGAGRITTGGTFTTAGSFGTFTASTGTVEYSGTNANIVAYTYNHLKISGSGTTTASGTTVINGDLTNTGGATLSFGTQAVTIASTATQSIAGFTTTGTVSMTKTGGTATLQGAVSGGALTINGTGGTLNAGTGLTHTFSGTWTRTAGTLDGGSSTINFSLANTMFSGSGGTFTASTGTVGYTNAAAQTFPALTYNNLTLSGGGVKTVATTPTVNGILSMEGTATITVTTGVVTYGTSATLKYNTTTSRTASTEEWISPFTATGGVDIASTGAITPPGAVQIGDASNASPLTIENGATLTPSSNLITVYGNFVNSGTFTSGSGGMTIAGTATQSIGGFTTTGTVTLTKTAAVATFQAAVNGGALTINGSGGTLNLGTGLTHTFTGTWTRTAGTLDGGSSTLNLQGGLSGTGGTFTASTGTVNYNGSGSQTVAGVTYNILKVNNATGATLGAATTTTTLTIGDVTGSSILDDGGFQLTSTGTLNLTSGTLKLGSAGTATTYPAFATNNITAGTTVEYASGVAQTVSITPSYSNLTFSGAGTKTPSSGTITVGGIWTVSSPAALNTNNNIANVTGNFAGTGSLTTGSGLFTLGGDWTNTGTFTTGSGGVTFSGGSGTQITGPSGGITFNTVTFNKAITNNNAGTITVSTALNGSNTLTQGSGSTLTLTFTGSLGITGLDASTNSNTVNYTAAGAQTVKAVSYSTLVLGNSGAKTMTSVTTLGNLTISGSATMTSNAAFTATGTLTYSSSGATTLTASTAISIGTLNQSNGTLNDNGNTITVTGSSTPWTKSGGTFTTTGTTVFNANADIATLLSGTPNFNNLTFSPTLSANHSYTMGVAPTITGNWTLNPSSANTLTVYLSADTIVTGTTNLSGTGSATSTLDTVTGQNRALTTGILTIGAPGTLLAQNSNITINGTSATIFSQAGTLTAGGSTVILSGSGAMTLTAATTFNNLTVTGTPTTSSNLTINGALSVSGSGNFSPSSGTLTLATTGWSISNSATLALAGLTISETPSSQSSASYSVTGALTINSGKTLAPSGGTISFTGGSIVNNGGATSNLVFNNITINSGTTTSSSSFSVGGNWTSNGTFTHSSGTVTFSGADGSTQAISGNTTFKNFTASTASNTTGRTIQFVGSSVTTVPGTWTITGSSGKVITLQSSNTSSWTINPTAASVDYASVSRSTNTGVSFCATHTTDGGNNSGWNITATASCNVTPSTPTLDTPADTATNQLLSPVLRTTTTDPESDYLRYKIELCTNVGMSVSCQTFDQTSSQTGWSGQNAQTSTAYTSTTQATYTIQTPLNAATTYYWRSYAIDPAGSNTWSATQGTPFSFTTTTAPSAPTTPWAEGTTNPTGILDLTPEFSAIYNDTDSDPALYYEIDVNTNNTFTGTVMWSTGLVSMSSLATGVRSSDVSYAGTALTYTGTTYYWRIRFQDNKGATGAWSATQNFSVNAPPATPTLDSPADTATNQTVTFLPLRTTASDTNSDYLRYKIELCTNIGMTVGCQTFDQTSSQTGWSGQDAQTSTAYASGTQATYTTQADLAYSTTYYWRSYAIDPAGSNTWSTTQGTPFSFTTTAPINLPLIFRGGSTLNGGVTLY